MRCRHCFSHAMKKKHTRRNFIYWSSLPTFQAALEYLLPFVVGFSKAELRFPILFVGPPVVHCFSSDFLKIAKQLFKGRGETIKLVCGARIWFASSQNPIGVEGETIIKQYGRVLNCHFKDFSNNYYFSLISTLTTWKIAIGQTNRGSF